MKKLFTLLAVFAFAVTASAQLTGIVHEVFYTDDSSIAGYPAGFTTYRIYAELADGSDAVTAVYAEPGSDLLLGTENDEIWNSNFGGTVGTELNPAFFPAFPESQYDSMVTIGRENSGVPGASITAVAVLPSSTAISTAFGTDSPLAPEIDTDLVLQDGTWFSTPDGANTTGQGANFRVLLAQITTSGDLEYNLNLQLIDGGLGGTAYKYVWNPASVDEANELDGSALGMSYVPMVAANGCMDMTACNYDAAATTDDGSCVFATGCDTCSGETDGTGVVIDNPEVGDACDDGNPVTINDTVQGDCSCAGTDPSLPQSQMDYASGNYDLCDMIKADWVGADDYRFVFTPQPAGSVISVEQGSQNTFLQLRDVDGLEVGITYGVTVDALFGASWSIGTVSKDVTVTAPSPYLNPADVCAMGQHFLGDYISAKPYVCGGDKWEWTFTAAGELPIVYTRNSANRYIRLSWVPGLMAGTDYTVSVRAGYPNGAYTAMSAEECISIVGTAPSLTAGGPEVNPEVTPERSVEEVSVALYPNPASGEVLNINLNGVETAKVTLDIVSMMGATVKTVELNAASNNVNEVISLNGIASGVYLVHIQMNGEQFTHRLIIQK